VETSTLSSYSCMILTTSRLSLRSNGIAAKVSHRLSVFVISRTMLPRRLFTNKSTHIGQLTTLLRMPTHLCCLIIRRLSFIRAKITSSSSSATIRRDVAACAPRILMESAQLTLSTLSTPTLWIWKTRRRPRLLLLGKASLLV